MTFMAFKEIVKNFFFPKMSKGLFIRIALFAIVTFLIFYFLIIPIKLRGKSMEPTLKDGSLHFITPVVYFFRAPSRGDIVAIKMAGRRVLLLKRIVALEGEEVSFKRGSLYINGVQFKEDYVKVECDWEYEGKIIEKGKVFVVGDNRGVPIESHDFGEVSKKRILGKLIW